MENNEHKIKTLADILAVVDEKNVENFLIDFSKWLRFSLHINRIGEILKTEVIREQDTFHWIDDGKNDANIHVTIKTK